MYCNFYFIMLLFFLSLDLVYFFLFYFFWGVGGWGGIILKDEKRCVLFDCVKVYLLPLSVSLLSVT